MSRGKIVALVVLGLLAVVLIFNSKPTMSLNVVFTQIEVLQSLGLLIFTTLGVIVGLLFR